MNVYIIGPDQHGFPTKASQMIKPGPSQMLKPQHTQKLKVDGLDGLDWKLLTNLAVLIIPRQHFSIAEELLVEYLCECGH